MTARRILIAFALLATLSGCQSEKDSTVPEHLLGQWTTPHPKYADRYFEIRNDVIIFGHGGESFEVHALTDVDQTREEGSILYTITHLNHDGKRFTFAFYYDPANNGAVRFKNQRDIVWTKETG
ncbi:MAG: hypothetical protein ACREKR_06620 [Candidatus Methylomirabilales bacterium]